MKSLVVSTILLGSIALTGCSRAIGPPTVPAGLTSDGFSPGSSHAAGYRVLHSFAGKDGANPEASLIGVNGTLYGTTQNGGTTNCSGGCGTVFSVSPTGTERVLYRFGGSPDGAGPTASLIDVNGTPRAARTARTPIRA